MLNSKKPTIIDLFSWCWWLSAGFMEAGYEIKLWIDNWADALETFKINHGNTQTYLWDLWSLDPKKISELFNIQNIDVIIGWPPCQGFSIAWKRNIDDPRNQLYKWFFRFVEYFKPKAFVMENVPNLASMSGWKVKEQILKDFESLWYTINYKILLASDYWVPQNRKRIVFVWLLNNQKFDFPDWEYGEWKKAKRTTKDAISDLPEISIENSSMYLSDPLSEYQKIIRQGSKGIFNHQICNHSLKTIETIGLVPDWWNYKSLPKELQNTRKVNIAWTRMNSNKPCFTIDTGHRHHFHYQYNRIPTVRESARIQWFKDSFIFLWSNTSQLKQVWNAVPPILGSFIWGNLYSFL